MNKQILKNTLVLVCITLIAGLALGLVHEVTKQPIEKQNQLAKETACKNVFEDADSFDTRHVLDTSNYSKVLDKTYESCSIDEAIPALDKDGSLLGYALTVTCSEGYGGDITIMMGITNAGTLNGIDFLSINETAGLGMNAKQPDFKNQFQNKPAQTFTVTKDDAAADNEIQAISAATITSKAVTKAVNAGIAYCDYLNQTTKGGSADE